MAQSTEKEQFNVIFPKDVQNKVLTIKEENELKKSEVVERLVERGLHADSRAQKISDDLRQMGTLLFGLGVGAFIVGLFWPGMDASGPIVLMLVFMAFAAASYLLSDEFAPEDL